MVGRRIELGLDLAAKGALFALLVVSAVAPDVYNYSERGVIGRAGAAVVALVAVPSWWLVFGRRAKRAYPFLIDALLPVPLIVDYVARALDWSDWAGWDVTVHAAKWAVLALVVSLVLIRLDFSPGVAAALCIGIGASVAIVRELLEYPVFQPEQTTEQYVNTVQDLGVGLGATAAVAAVVLVVRRAHR